MRRLMGLCEGHEVLDNGKIRHDWGQGALDSPEELRHLRQVDSAWKERMRFSKRRGVGGKGAGVEEGWLGKVGLGTGRAGRREGERGNAKTGRE